MLNLPKHQTLDTHAQNTAIHHLRMQVSNRAAIVVKLADFHMQKKTVPSVEVRLKIIAALLFSSAKEGAVKTKSPYL